jgi:hypothetical protein
MFICEIADISYYLHESGYIYNYSQKWYLNNPPKCADNYIDYMLFNEICKQAIEQNMIKEIVTVTYEIV